MSLLIWLPIIAIPVNKIERPLTLDFVLLLFYCFTFEVIIVLFTCSLTNLSPAFWWKVTGEPLIQRKDDTAAVLKSRLEAFHRQTEPVIGIHVFLYPLSVIALDDCIRLKHWKFVCPGTTVG